MLYIRMCMMTKSILSYTTSTFFFCAGNESR